MKHTTQLKFCVAVISFMIILLTGCEKQITRKADWETNFNDLHFVDAKHGWIVGEKGMIIHTNDGGKTWERQETGTEGDFKSVYFTTLLNGWAVGNNGLIIATDDGGKHWYLQESGIYSMLNGVFFANSKEGWVVGEDADILSTQDGGKTWKRQSVSEFPFPFNDVWFMDNRHGWVVGSYDRIFYTEDGGKTWRDGTSNLLKGNDQGRLYDNKNVFFIPNFFFSEKKKFHHKEKKRKIYLNQNEGWIVGSDGSIWHTTNGGIEWIPQDSRIPLINGVDKFDIYSIHFANNKRGALVAQFGFINYTEDGGKNWRLVESGTDNHLTAVQFTSPTEVWAVGWYGTILHSQNSGATWQMVSGTTANDLQEVQFADANRAIAVGKHGTIAMSQDGGQTWTDVQTDIWDDIRGVYFASDKEGWAVGERGLIVHTTDGGQSWKPQTSGSGFPLNSAHFVTPEKGWVVGELGTVLHTDDGGQSWVPQTQEEWQMFKGVFFLDEKEGWVVGWPGLVMHTTNGGLTWTKQDTKTYNELYAVHFIDNNTGWVVGQFGEILHTNDGGVTWKFQHSGTQANLNKVYFADANMGIITGDNGVILMTANGGQKWHLQDSGTDNDLYGFALSPTGLVAVGKNGIATRYSIDTEKIPVELPPVQLPPVAEETKEPQVIVEQPTVEEVSYQWEIIRQATWRTDFADVYFLDEQTGWAVGSGGVIAHTTDSGKTWRPQHSGVKDDLRLVTFVDNPLTPFTKGEYATHGWIAGSGVLLRTENSGETWQVIRDVLNASTIDYDLESPTFHLAKSQLTVQTMQFLNPKEGWLGVDEGQFCHTTDGGLTWKIHQTATTYSPITHLQFINNKEGWAVAPDRFDSERPGGLILHTVNGGVYWQIQYKTKQPGVAVHFTDAKSGWVVMEDGNSLVTDDGGVTWIMKPSNLVDDTQLKISPHHGRILLLKFRNHKEAWGIGSDGSILVTRDQGESWTKVYISECKNSIFATNVYFVDDQHAWAVARSGQIYHTADGGKTWERQLGEQLDDLRDALFFSATHGVIAGDNGLLLETQDGGQTWTQLQSGTQQTLIGVHFPSDVIFNNVIASKAKQSQRSKGEAESSQLKWGWAMGRDGVVLYTTDGYKWSTGKKPIKTIEPTIPLAMNDVAFGSFSEGWAVGNDGQIIHNQDGGPIWTSQHTSTRRELIGLEMRHAPVGWAVGRGGVILRTINGGEYWKLHETNIGYDLHAVSFSPTDDRKGWAAGRYGIILSTTDGGFTWKAESSGVTKDLYGLLALSDKEIYAVGAEGTIIHSVDGGVTWRQQHTDIDNDLYAIALAKDGDTLWVVGQWGVVLRRKIGHTEKLMR